MRIKKNKVSGLDLGDSISFKKGFFLCENHNLHR